MTPFSEAPLKFEEAYNVKIAIGTTKNWQTLLLKVLRHMRLFEDPIQKGKIKRRVTKFFVLKDVLN